MLRNQGTGGDPGAGVSTWALAEAGLLAGCCLRVVCACVWRLSPT